MQFLALMDRTELSVLEIRKKEGQLKAALFQSLAKNKLTQDEISVYKRKLKKLEDEKLDVMFASLKDVREMLRQGKSENLDQDILEYYRSTLEK